MKEEKEKMRRKKLSKNNIKVERGITLIVLIITVITLLILAGITVTMLTGENGILIRASEASEQTKIGDEKEAYKICRREKLQSNFSMHLYFLHYRKCNFL